jgi:hypothetical protein
MLQAHPGKRLYARLQQETSLVNEVAEKNFVGNARALKQLEKIENSLGDNAKIVITEHGISPMLLMGGLPVSVSNEKDTR